MSLIFYYYKFISMKKFNINPKIITSMLIVICAFSLTWCSNIEDKSALQDETKIKQESTNVEDKNYVDGAEEICLSEGWTYELFYSEEEWNYSKCTYENWATVIDYKDFGDFFEN